MFGIRKVVSKLTMGSLHSIMANYYRRFKKYAFIDLRCDSEAQYEASITRLYHTIEKGLTYKDYRPGFGRGNIEKLITSLKQVHEKGYDIHAFYFETAISCLNEYVKRNREAGSPDIELEKRIEELPGEDNKCGGTIQLSAPKAPQNMNFQQLISSRHSIRHFSGKPVDIETLEEAIRLAQFTPSACNRQGWKTRVISDPAVKESVLKNQNGNRGFGQEIDKLLVITSDLRAQQKSRELFQAYIDGGMYAQNVLNALYSRGIGSVPLSASLTPKQEKNVRRILSINEAEVLILFVGIGNYPEEDFLATRSARKQGNVEII